MYLISAYFDQKTNEKIQGFINKIANKPGGSSSFRACASVST